MMAKILIKIADTKPFFIIMLMSNQQKITDELEI